MIKIQRRRHRAVPALNTAALPDLIFTVLFFFMIVTHMRTETPPTGISIPEGTELTNTPKKHPITHLYIRRDGTMQLGSTPVTLQQLTMQLKAEQRKLAPEEREQATVAIRADRQVSMKTIIEVKQALRQAGACRISYAAMKATEDQEQK